MFGMILNYYAGDFERVGSPFSSDTALNLQSGTDLFNGNIKSWQQNIKAGPVPELNYEHQVAQEYRYDQLNRITWSHFWNYTTDSFLWRPAVTLSPYDESFSYDYNGNLSTLTRTSDESNTMEVLDQLSYTPATGLDNKVVQITDAVTTYDIIQTVEI